MEAALNSCRDLKNQCAAKHPGSWDQSAALESVGGDEILLFEVIQAFLKESPNLVTRIEQALSLHDPGLLELAAHSLKGALDYLGVPDAYLVAQRLETAGRAGDLDAAGEVFAELHNRLVFLWAALGECTNAGA
jgi:HPt (histidine-containing phosphotransfer) domain-containing protein